MAVTLATPHIVQTRTSFCEKFKKKIAPHTDLLQSFSYMAMNIAILAGKIFKEFPAVIANSARGLLSFLGVISLNLSVEQILKSAGDIARAWRCKDYKAVFLTAVKVVVVSINILLTLGSLAAAIVMLCGLPAHGLLVYMFMRPFALTSLVTDVVLQALNYAENHRVLKKLERTIHPDENRQRHIVERVCKVLVSAPKGVDYKFEATLIRQMSTYSLKQFKKEIKGKSQFTDEEIKKLFAQLKNSIDLNETMYKTDLGLRALGYTAMYFCRLFPETILDKSLQLGMNVIYTGKMIYQKNREEKPSKKES